MEDVKSYYTIPKKIMVSFLISGATLVQIIVNSSLMKYYTSFIGLSPGVWATIYFIFTIWNAINDPVIGYWADKQKFIPGKGKYARLIRWAIPVMAITVIPLFYVNPSWSQISMATYLLVLMVVYEASQTLTNVSFNAFKVNTFLSMSERSEMQMINTYVKMPTTFLAMMIPMWFLTGDYSTKTVAVIFTGAIGVGLLFMLIGIIFLKEDIKFYQNQEPEHSFSEMFVLFLELIKSKSFRIFVISMFLIGVATGNYGVGYIYYMDDVLQVSELKVVIPDILTGIVQMLFFPFIVSAISKKGSRDVFATGLIIAVIGHAVIAFPVNYWVVASMYIVILIGYGFYSIIMEPLQGLIVDEIELETGRRQPAAIAGIIQVFLVLAAGMMPVIIGLVLEISGYVTAEGAVQTPQVMQSIRYATGAVPAVILLIGILVLKRLPIDHKREKEIQKLIEAKHGKSAK